VGSAAPVGRTRFSYSYTGCVNKTEHQAVTIRDICNYRIVLDKRDELGLTWITNDKF